MSIDKQVVAHVAHLARIELEDKELDKLSTQLEDILRFIDKLSKLDVSKVEPTSHILPIKNVLRDDLPGISLSNEQVLANAPQKEGNFFVVPKVIE
ncbi:MAG: Asp-tRNA(Asn)/Glu-tRNA(Gln) amidotransferase subunit GatC [Candidatus Omnitrophota bacterium]